MNATTGTIRTEVPALVLSTTKAFRFRPFEMSIILSKQWMLDNHINSEMVLSAGFNTKCCFENNPTEAVGPCKKCGSKKKTLISIKTSSKAVFGPHEIAPGVLKFTFNLCRSACTSSRDHLRSRIVLVVDGIKGLQLRSAPLVLRSREKGTLPSSTRTSPSASASVTPSTVAVRFNATSDSDDEDPAMKQQRLAAASTGFIIDPNSLLGTSTASVSASPAANGMAPTTTTTSTTTTTAPSAVAVAGLEYSSWYFAQQEANLLQQQPQSVLAIERQPSLLQQVLQRDPTFLMPPPLAAPQTVAPVAIKPTPSLSRLLLQQECQQPALPQQQPQQKGCLPSLSELFPNSCFSSGTLPPLMGMPPTAMFTTHILPPPTSTQ